MPIYEKSLLVYPENTVRSEDHLPAIQRRQEESAKPLKSKLDALPSEFKSKVPPEICEAMANADMEPAAPGITKAPSALFTVRCA